MGRRERVALRKTRTHSSRSASGVPPPSPMESGQADGGGACWHYHHACLAAAMQPLQGRRHLTNYPRVARSSQPWAERFPSFQDGGSAKMRPPMERRLTNYPRVARSSRPWAERSPSVQDGGSAMISSPVERSVTNYPRIASA